MPQNLDISRDTIMQIDRYIKAGRIHFTLLSNQEFDRVQSNEIYIDYGVDENGIPIHPTNGNMPMDGKPLRGTVRIKGPNGEKVELVGVTATKLKEFINNFLEVSVNRTKDYEPSMWLMLREDNQGDTGYNDSTIEQFYDFIKKNKSELTPYILQTFKEGKRDILIPYVTTDLIFYDVSKIIEGESIKNVDDVFELLYKLSTEVAKSVNTLVDSLRKKMENTLANLNANYTRSVNTMSTIEGSIRGLKQELSKYEGAIEKAVAVGKSAYTKKDITVKRGDVIVINTKGIKPGSENIEIPDIDINDTTAINSWKPTNTGNSSGFNTCKMIFIYTYPKYMNIMETVSKAVGQRMTDAELKAFLTKHKMATEYKLTDNTDLLDYRFENDKTFIVNMLPLNGEKPKDKVELDDDPAIPICNVKITYVNRLQTQFPANNSNGWNVGTQELSFFKGDKLMPWHLQIPNGYIIYRMPCNAPHQHNPMIHGYIVTSSMNMVVEVTPTEIPVYTRFFGYGNTQGIINMNPENLMLATDIYDKIGLGRWSKKGIHYASPVIRQQLIYSPTLTLWDTEADSYSILDGSGPARHMARLNLSSPDIGHLWKRDEYANQKFYTVHLTVQVYDSNGRLLPGASTSYLMQMVKAGYHLTRNNFDINPTGANGRYVYMETTFDTPVQNIRSNQYHTVKLKLANSGATYVQAHVHAMKFKSAWFTEIELNQMDTIFNHPVVYTSWNEIQGLENRHAILPIRYNFREWNPIDNRWENTHSSANKHYMVIPKHTIGGMLSILDVNLTSYANDFYHDIANYPNGFRVPNADNGEVLEVKLVHHTEVFKLVRLHYRDAKNELLYISEFKLYIPSKNTVTAEDVQRYKPDFINLNLTGFTTKSYNRDSAPVINIDIKTATLKNKQTKTRETTFKYHIEGNTNLIIYTQKVDTTNWGNTIKHKELPSFIVNASNEEIYHGNGTPNTKLKNHRFFPSDTVNGDTTYNLNQIVNIPVVDGIKFVTFIERLNVDNQTTPTNDKDNYTKLAELLISNNNDMSLVKSKLAENKLDIRTTNYILMRKGIDYSGRVIYTADGAFDHYKPVINMYSLDGSTDKWYGALDTYVNRGNHTIITAAKRFYIKQIFRYGSEKYVSSMSAHNVGVTTNTYIYHRWIPVSEKPYTVNASWYPQGFLYFGNANGSDLNSYVNKITNNTSRPTVAKRSIWPSLTGNVDIYIKFDLTNGTYNHMIYKKFTVPRNLPIATYNDITGDEPIRYQPLKDAKLVAIGDNFINRGEYFCSDNCLVLNEYIRWSTRSLKLVATKSEAEFKSKAEALTNMWYYQYKGTQYKGTTVNINDADVNFHNTSMRKYTAVNKADNNSILTPSTPTSNSNTPNSQGIIVPPVKINNNTLPVVPIYTPDTMNPEAFLSPIILTGNNDGTRVYIEFGPGINTYLPYVGTNDTIDEFNRIKSSDITVAQYGNPKHANTVSFTEVTDNGTIYIGCNYDMTFSLYSSYLSKLNIEVKRNSVGINNIVSDINGKRDLATLGLTSFRNSVVTRDATISIPRGIRMTSDITMLPGLSALKVLHPELPTEVDVALLDREFSIPLRKLSLRTTYIKFDNNKNIIQVPTSYWKPGFTLTVAPYVNGGATVRYTSKIKSQPTQDEIDTGIMSIEFDRRLAISVGMTVGYTIDAPNWKTSDEVLDVVKLI